MTVGVVVMAYGTPSSLEDVESYYTHIRHGRPPTAELLDALRSRDNAIGGVSPLRQITEAQAARLQAALGDGHRVTLGLKHSSPFIEDAVPADVERVIGVVLAPHYSRGSVGEYLDRLRESAAGKGLEASGIESWWDLDAWVEFQAAAVREALATMPARTTVLFTAHSLPERVLDGDPYPDQLETSAKAIAQRAGIDRWRLAWQSSPRGASAPDPAAGQTTDPWRGPDILDVLPDLDADGVVVCPQGFTADHLEVLYDLDIEAAGRARDIGLTFARTRSLNDDDGVLTALAERIKIQ